MPKTQLRKVTIRRGRKTKSFTTYSHQSYRKGSGAGYGWKVTSKKPVKKIGRVKKMFMS